MTRAGGGGETAAERPDERDGDAIAAAPAEEGARGERARVDADAPRAEGEDIDPRAKLWFRGLQEVRRSRTALTGLERTLVLTGRREGATWACIAEALGVTKQTALRRHRAADPVAQALARAHASDPWLQELAALRALARQAGSEPPAAGV